MSSSHRVFKSAGGVFNEEKTPKLNTLSPSAGQAYVTSAQRYCLLHLSEVVSTFCMGVLPIELLEFPLSYDRRNMLGRKAGKYHDSKGSLMTVDQSIISWRTQLIAETRVANANCSQEEAIDLLFPSSGRKSRENKRQLFATQSLQLLNNLNLLWPSDAMVLDMSKDKSLRDATNIGDLIAWENAFISFSLDNCGNADMNVKAAEDTLEAGKMKGLDLASYVKSFRTATENCRRCKSTYTEKRIVEIFIRNLNQTDEAFYRFSTKILDSSDSLHSLTTSSLESAIAYVENYYKKVIIPERASNKLREGISGSIQNVSELKSIIASSAEKGTDQISVPVTILAMMIKDHNNNNNNRVNNEARSKKRKAEAAKEEARKNAATETQAEVVDSTANTSVTKQRVCYKFEQTGECSYGDRCYFSHV